MCEICVSPGFYSAFSEVDSMIQRLAKGAIAVYVAWLDEDGLDRTIVGGILLCLMLVNIIVLTEVFTDPQLSGLLIDLGVVGETSVFSIIGWMVLFYILRPVRVLTRARDESRQQVDEWFEAETEARLE